jgi:hypothetical protein
MSPLAVLTKLAAMLRNVPAVQLVFAKFATLLRSKKGSGEPLLSEFLGEASDVPGSTVDQHTAVLQPSNDHAISETNGWSEREQLILRRWPETGIKLWNPDHGAGRAALNIQGQSKLLPPKPGEKLPRYDTLEFKMVRSNVNGQAVNRIVCEGVVVDPPKRRRKPRPAEHARHEDEAGTLRLHVRGQERHRRPIRQAQVPLFAKEISLFPRFKIPALNRPPAPHKRNQRTRAQILAEEPAKATRRVARAKAA